MATTTKTKQKAKSNSESIPQMFYTSVETVGFKTHITYKRKAYRLVDLKGAVTTTKAEAERNLLKFIEGAKKYHQEYVYDGAIILQNDYKNRYGIYIKY